jgi:putative oxidoreductase
VSWWSLTPLPLTARVCLVLLFPFSALDKIVFWKDALKQANSSFIPGGAALLVIAIAIELLAPACIIIGWHIRFAAVALAGFCVVTAGLYHPFWQFADFWTPGDSKGRNHFWDFLKNFGLAGGLIVLAIAADGAPDRASTSTHRQSAATHAASAIASTTLQNERHRNE